MADEPQPGEPEEPDELPRIPGFVRASSFGGTGGDFDPSRFDFSPDRPRPGDADAAVDRARSTGRSPARPRSGSRSRASRNRRCRPARPRAVRGARARGADPRGRRDRAHRDVRHRRSRTVGAEGMGRSPPRRAAPRARGPRHHARRGDAAVEETTTTTTTSPAQRALPGLPGRHAARCGNMLGLLAPALLGVQAGSMIGYLAQHALGRYDLPLPTGPAALGDSPGGDEPSLTLRRPQHRRVRGGVVAPARRPALLRRAPRGRARGGALGAVGARPARAPRRSSTCRATRSTRGVRSRSSAMSIPRTPSRSSAWPTNPAAHPGRDAVAAPGRAPGGAATAHRRCRRLRRLRARAQIGRRLIPTFDQIHEAMKRHRVERGEAERFIEGLLGLKLERAHYERGQAFCRRRGRAGRHRRPEPPVGGARRCCPPRTSSTRPASGWPASTFRPQTELIESPPAPTSA